MKTKLFIIAIIIIGFIGFYFLYTKPHAKELYALNRDRCFQQGMARYENDLKQKTEDVTLFTPAYYYNETTKNSSKSVECVYVGGAIMSEGVTEQYIYDVYSGKRLAWYSFFPSKNLTLGSREEFKTLESKYSTKY